MSVSIGNYAYCVTIGKLFSKSKDSFLSKMRKGYGSVSPFPLGNGQIAAWADCYDVLEKAFDALPEEFFNLWAVFEYVLPKYKPGTKRFENEVHIVADVILLSRDVILVLEFKQKKDPFPGLFKQAKKYQNRLAKYHVESNNAEVKSLLVLTKAKDYKGEIEVVPGCSPDGLAEEITRLMGEQPKSRSYNTWLNSEFSSSPLSSDETLDEEEYEDGEEMLEEEALYEDDVDERMLTFEELFERYEVGSFVEHSKFGVGYVLELTRNGKDSLLTVQFASKKADLLFLSCVEKNIIKKLWH